MELAVLALAVFVTALVRHAQVSRIVIFALIENVHSVVAMQAEFAMLESVTSQD